MIDRRSRVAAVALVTFATFTDILAYSIAVPVLPDIGKRFGASPTVIGLLFASFGLTVLLTSVPTGAISDRIGRKLPLVAGLIALALSTVAFAFAPSLPWLFAARLIQGAADAVTWVVGFAVIADLYAAEDRGRVMGFVMSGTTVGFLLGPAVGGWLYEAGGPRLPYLVVAGLATVAAAGVAWLHLPAPSARRDTIPLRTVAHVPDVVVCAAAVVVGGGTLAMTEPVLSLFLSDVIGLGPARIGIVFGAGAVVTAALHPLFGGIAGRLGGRRLTLVGLGALGAILPIFSRIWSFESGIGFYAAGAVAAAMLVTPSLAFMAEAVSAAGIRSFGVAYGLYNFAWALGLLVGPSLGGFLYERVGFTTLMLVWGAFVVLGALTLARVGGSRGRSDAPPLPRAGRRVVLRRLAPADLEAFQSYRSDAEVGRYQDWTPQSDLEALQFITEMSGAALFPRGRWVQIAIVERRTDSLIGDIGIRIAADGDEAEIGVTLSAAAQGAGLGREAVSEAIGLIFDLAPVVRIVATTDARNLRAVRLLERVGMQRVASRAAVFRGARCIEHVYTTMRPRNSALG